VSEIFEVGSIMEYVCPRCSFDIAFTQGPTIEEHRAHWDECSDADKKVVLLVEAQRGKGH
jgi:hypothetical protein